MVDFLEGSELMTVKEMEERLSVVAKENEISGMAVGNTTSIKINHKNYDVPAPVFRLIECLVEELRELKNK